MSDEGVWVQAGTLTLPYDTLRTLHTGVSEVRLLSSVVTNLKQVGKRVSLLGRENTLAANEVSFLREIDHANVAKVFDIAEVAGSDPLLAEFEIIMPYYENGSLLDCLVRGERFSIGEARDITVKALRGLAHLHDRHRILHRDVKPANLFRSDDDSLVKIGDFGEAMRMSEDANCEPLLSPQFWTSPETFRGMRYTAASDLYSLGLSFFELLSGPFPYDDYTLDRLATRLKKGHRGSAAPFAVRAPRASLPQAHRQQVDPDRAKRAVPVGGSDDRRPTWRSLCRLEVAARRGRFAHLDGCVARRGLPGRGSPCAWKGLARYR